MHSQKSELSGITIEDLKLASMFSPQPASWVTDVIGTCAYGDYYEPGVVIVDCRDLADGANPSVRVWGKIKTALSAIESGQMVLLQCVAGVSRSNAIAAAVLSVHESMPYNRALRKVCEKVPRAYPNRSMLTTVRHAIREHCHTERCQARECSRWRK